MRLNDRELQSLRNLGNDAERAADEIAELRAAVSFAAHQLEKARVWDGAHWHYNPLHPIIYRSALERLRDTQE